MANFTHREFSAAGFKAWQARQGAKGGKSGCGSNGGKLSKGGGRPKGTTRINWDLWDQINSMKKQGFTHAMIAEDLCISGATVSKYINISK